MTRRHVALIRKSTDGGVSDACPRLNNECFAIDFGVRGTARHWSRRPRSLGGEIPSLAGCPITPALGWLPAEGFPRRHILPVLGAFRVAARSLGDASCGNSFAITLTNSGSRPVITVGSITGSVPASATVSVTGRRLRI